MAILKPRTGVVSKPDMAALPIWDGQIDDGEAALILGYPAIPRRQTVLTPKTAAVCHMSDYAGRGTFLGFNDRLEGGYSGGPVFNGVGYVVGVATEETFNQPGSRGEPAVAFGQATLIKYIRDLTG